MCVHLEGSLFVGFRREETDARSAASIKERWNGLRCVRFCDLGDEGLQLGRISVDISHEKVHADDCIDCGEGREGRIDRFERVIKVLDTQLDSEMQDKLVEIAGKCPVHRTLEASSVVATKIE